MYFKEMSSPVIQAQGLGKRYRTYAKPINRLKQSLFRNRTYFQEFWALRNVNLELEQGASLAIIGRNGSGKSTLLQLLCGILAPTEGSIAINGKIGALLELGSGFNPEFTGLENIYLNASILGLTREQTEDVIDDIQAFADIGDFVHQPIKTYSSGMIVRLAFSVMAYIDAEILVIDEALAVGDAFFTQKCSRFLKGFREKGTLLFVSHDMESVKALCERAIWIDRGQLKQDGDTRNVANAYFAEAYGRRTEEEAPEAESETDVPASRISPISTPESSQPVARSHPWFDERQNQWGDKAFGTLMQVSSFHEAIQNSEQFGSTDLLEIVHVELIDPVLGCGVSICRGGYPYALHILCICKEDTDEPDVGFCLNDKSGQVLFGDNTSLNNHRHQWSSGITYRIIFEFDFPLLRVGEYTLTVAAQRHGVVEPHIYTWIHDALLIVVHQSSIGVGLSGVPMRKITVSEEGIGNSSIENKNKSRNSLCLSALDLLRERDVQYRINMTTSCRDSDPIDKVENAGKCYHDQDNQCDVQLMHNGLRVVKGGYYGDWMTEIIENLKGHHEPQEELVFSKILERIGDEATMIELGSFWSYYSLWFLKGYHATRKAICLEADPKHVEIGRQNAALNGLSPVFINGVATREGTNLGIEFETESSGVVRIRGWSVADLMNEHTISQLDILHVDTQGAEYEVLQGAQAMVQSGRIRFLVVSTHSYEICGDPLMHQRCLAWLINERAHIICEHDVHESFSGDGLIVASFAEYDRGWVETISRNRYQNSLFPNPAYYVPMRPRTLNL
jgi:lipopolysaccharide transport system ATP-binding protein